MRWFGWFRKAPPEVVTPPPEPPAPAGPVNVIGSIKLPEPTDPKWRVDNSDSQSSSYRYGDYGNDDHVWIWCWHPDKTGTLHVGSVELLRSNKDVYALGQAIYEVHGAKKAGEEKRKRIRALEVLEKLTGEKR